MIDHNERKFKEIRYKRRRSRKEKKGNEKNVFVLNKRNPEVNIGKNPIISVVLL